ncbi:MAG: class I SAM-dependent methyltransferase [Nitrospirae bacterium]|nr:class I SAM-dependent methyltransferase [Nitrospirota bacterium]
MKRSDEDKELALFYEKWAIDEYEAHEIHVNQVQNLKADIFVKLINDSAIGEYITSIADIGCSTGLMLKVIGGAVNAKHMLGIDISEATISKARDYNASNTMMTFYTCDGSLDHTCKIVKQYLEEHGLQTISAIIMADFLEHCDNPQEIISSLKTYCNMFLIKIPIEFTFWDNVLRKWFGKKIFPGPKHPDGHVWETNYHGARKFISMSGLVPIIDYYWKYPEFVRYAPHIVKEWKQKPLVKRMLLNTEIKVHRIVNQWFNAKTAMQIIGGGYFCIAKMR